jgi:hypothetical protein
MLRLLIRPFGYLAFVLALATLSAAAWLLGEGHELGFFAGRLSKTMWRYPEIIRRGVQMAWVVWAAGFGAAFTDSTPWDERGLAVVGLVALWRHWRHFAGGHRAER